MKNERLYKTSEEYNNDIPNLSQLNHYLALSKDDNSIHYTNEPEYLDILIYDMEEDSKFEADGKDWNIERFPLSRYIPIGVKVISRSNMDDGCSRYCALHYASCLTPDSGTNNNEGIIFSTRENIQNIPTDLTYVPYIADSGTANFGNIQELKGYCKITTQNEIFCSDSFDALENPFLKGYYYNINNNINKDDSIFYIPAPILEDNSSNPIFFSKENPQNILQYIDGKYFTRKILENCIDESYKTATTIQNIVQTGHYPTAEAVWRYHTIGTNQGDWYIPTASELLFLYLNLSKLTNTFVKLNLNRINAIRNLYSFRTCSQYDFEMVCTLNSTNIEYKDTLESCLPFYII